MMCAMNCSIKFSLSSTLSSYNSARRGDGAITSSSSAVRRLNMRAVLCVFAAIYICGVAFVNGEKRLRILHTNDMHARFEQTSQLSSACSASDAAADRCYGGFARILTAVKQQRQIAEQNGTPVLFLNAGDTYQGSTMFSVFKWPVVSAFVDLLGIDVMSLGNHEFDDGPPGLAPFLRNVSIPVVACNVNFTNEPDLANTPVIPTLVLERGGLRIGIIGYITPETSTLSQPGNKVVFNDEIASITAETRRLKLAGVPIIIALGHSGYDIDMKIAHDVPDVDVVIGGHSHTFLYTGEQPDSDVPVGPYPTYVKQPSGRIVPVVQAYAFTKYLGVLDLVLDESGEVINATGQPLLLNASVPEDQSILVELEKWQKQLDNRTAEPIGVTRVLLNGTCRFTECNAGNLVADAFIDYTIRNMVGRNWTDVAIAIIGGGSIRSSINPYEGVITREDVLMTMPFMNSLEAILLKGEYLLQALEWSVARYDPTLTVGRGEFLQMSGIQVTYDLRQPVGARVARARARCAHCPLPIFEDIDPKKDYGIVVSTYVANGGDNYTMISQHKTLLAQFELTDTNIVMDFIERRQLIYNGLEDRIMFVGSGEPLPNSLQSTSSRAISQPISLLLTLLLTKFLHVTG